jgi:hypothetical protein
VVLYSLYCAAHKMRQSARKPTVRRRVRGGPAGHLGPVPATQTWVRGEGRGRGARRLRRPFLRTKQRGRTCGQDSGLLSISGPLTTLDIDRSGAVGIRVEQWTRTTRMGSSCDPREADGMGLAEIRDEPGPPLPIRVGRPFWRGPLDDCAAQRVIDPPSPYQLLDPIPPCRFHTDRKNTQNSTHHLKRPKPARSSKFVGACQNLSSTALVNWTLGWELFPHGTMPRWLHRVPLQSRESSSGERQDGLRPTLLCWQVSCTTSPKSSRPWTKFLSLQGHAHEQAEGPADGWASRSAPLRTGCPFTAPDRAGQAIPPKESISN